MFSATCSILQKIIVNGSTYSQRGYVDAAYNILISFEFIFILHLMKELMGITNILCQALQEQSQDIVNTRQLVHTAKVLTQKLRDNDWQDLLNKVTLFCEQHDIDIPDFSAPFVARQGFSGHQKDHITMKHYYRVQIFLATIDKQLLELNIRFNDKALELLTPNSHLVPKDAYKAFNIDDICTLVGKYYSDDFTEQEKMILKSQLQHFIIDASNHPDLKNLSTIPELCCALVRTEKFKVYYLIDQLIRLILTLLVTTDTTERSFSAMKIIKTRLSNKMEDDFLADKMVIYIEREIAASFTFDSIIDDFKSLKKWRAAL